jgi:hypothetical protein
MKGNIDYVNGRRETPSIIPIDPDLTPDEIFSKARHKEYTFFLKTPQAFVS